MKIRIATSETPHLISELVSTRSLEQSGETNFNHPRCVRCGVAVGTRAIRRGDVVVPLCPLDCSERTPTFESVVRDWIDQRRKRAPWEQLARERGARVRRTVRRVLAA